MLTNLLNDVMLGEPEITPAPVGLGVIDPDYINIMITGHQHSIFVHLQEQLKKPEVQELAKAAGARGWWDAPVWARTCSFGAFITRTSSAATQATTTPARLSWPPVPSTPCSVNSTVPFPVLNPSATV
jgi:hydroxylamine reductase (hybrid-cluster protein)